MKLGKNTFKKTNIIKGEIIMKNKKLKLLVLALAVCLIAVASLGTLAWFTANDSVTNNFYIANSEDDPDAIFSVDVWEDDTLADPDGEEKIQGGINYPNILPGDNLYKEVNIENTGSYEQYIRATVTVSDASVWQTIFGETYVPLEKLADNLNEKFDVWSVVYDIAEDTLTYVLYYDSILPAEGEDIVTLFTNIHIPEAINRFQAAELAGSFTISVVADAVQTKNVGDNASDAFKTVGMEIAQGESTLMNELAITESLVNNDSVVIEGGTINVNKVGLENYGSAVLTDVAMNAGSPADYSNILGAGSETEYNEVDITSAGGGVGAVDGAKVVFNSGSVAVNSASTSGRYLFYAVGEGTEVIINDGEFSFSATLNQKRAYIYASSGATVYVNGGNFGKASTRDGYTAGILTANGGTVVITGGTFGFDPSAWVAEGYEAVLNGSVWTVNKIA